MSCCNEEKTLEYIQGDTFYRQVVVETTEGEPVDVSYISKVEFLLLNLGATVEETEELDYDSETAKWSISVSTENWSVGTHIMRYRVTYTDGHRRTPYEANIQIKK